jgi:hypothetical protein
MVPRRVGSEGLGDPGCLERFAQSSRPRRELVSLGSAGGGWTGDWPRCGRQSPTLCYSFAILQTINRIARHRKHILDYVFREPGQLWADFSRPKYPHADDEYAGKPLNDNFVILGYRCGPNIES